MSNKVQYLLYSKGVVKSILKSTVYVEAKSVY